MKNLYVALWLICITSGMEAKLVMPAYFTDNMVLQQKADVSFHGLSSSQKEITVRVGWNKTIYRASADAEGKWSVAIPTPSAGGPYTILISDQKDEQVLSNVMVGEVWFCSGQSNMEMPLAGWGKVLNYEEEIATSDYPSIRLFQVRKNTSLVPLSDFQSTMGGWKTCSPATVPEFSAVAYFYARRLWQELRVPVGVIDCTWGGTPAEAWSSIDAMKQITGYEKEVEALQASKLNPQELQNRYEQELRSWQELLQTRDEGLHGGQAIWASTQLTEQDWSEMTLPCYWERSGLPDFDGVVWFRRQVQLPKSWAGQPLTLSLGMIDDEDIVYCNGTELARGQGYNTPRVYTVPADRTNTSQLLITVRVSDSGGEGGIHGDAADLFLSTHDGERISLSGNWKYKIGISLADIPAQPLSPLGNSGYPTVLYNAMVNPLVHFPVKGVIWYQGEANEFRAKGYADLFQSLIYDWRSKWNNPEMPFYFVQLANYMERKAVQPDSRWATVREGQAKVLHLSHTGMAVNIDLGVADDIHPRNKQEVAHRLSLLSLKETYGKKIIAQAPAYKDYQLLKSGKVRIDFDTTRGEFERKGDLKGFVIAGANHVFYPAEAFFDGNSIIVHSPQVSYPVAVRYAWADNPECTLRGSTGLPVAPFRTDNWW